MCTLNINEEILQLCQIIEKEGKPLADGKVGVTFGFLFDAYENISENLVGLLRRARKQKYIDFEGEMLFQNKDEQVAIHLIKMPEEKQE